VKFLVFVSASFYNIFSRPQNSLGAVQVIVCSRDSTVGIVNTLWAGRSGVRLPARERNFFSPKLHTDSDPPPPPPRILFNMYLRFFPLRQSRYLKPMIGTNVRLPPRHGVCEGLIYATKCTLNLHVRQNEL
jgi:hypothetical protein